MTSDSDSVIQAFSAEHVADLTGLSKGQLAYMDRTGFFQPDFAFEDRSSPFSRIYSFRDVVGLRTVAILRKDHRISLQKLRKVVKELKKHRDKPWSGMRLFVFGKEVHFREPESGRMRGALTRQFVASYALEDIENDITARVRKLKERKANQVGHVERHRYVAHNAWVLAGTRIPTSAIKSYRDAGYTIEQILEEYPALKRRDVEAALAHEERLAKSA